MSELDEAPECSGAGTLRDDLADFQHDLAELRRANDLSFEAMGRRIAGNPEVMGSASSFHTLLSAPLLRPPRQRMLRGFLIALELPEETAAEWERRRQELADRWEHAHFARPEEAESEPTAEQRARPGRRPLVVASAVIVLALVAVVLWVQRPATQSITGEVRCLSGAAVAGVFVAVPGSDASGFAKWKADPGASSRASYSWVVPSGHRYALHVGCGAQVDGWVTDNWSPEVEGDHQVVVCDDLTPLRSHEHYGRCTAE